MKELLTREEALHEIERQTHALNGNTMHCSTRWQKRWAPSSHFVLMEVALDKVEQPKAPHSMRIVASQLQKFNEAPIFIDRNYRANTHWHEAKTHGRKLTTHVVDGKHRHLVATIRGHKTIMAYVGVQGIYHFMDPDAQGYNWVDYKPKVLAFIKKYRSRKTQ